MTDEFPDPEKQRQRDNRRLVVSLFIPAVFVALIWLVKLFEFVTEIDLALLGVLPRTLKGFPGILFSPLIHGDWDHLLSNTLPFLILGFLLIYSYPKVALKVFVFIYLASGFMVWLIGREAYHIGASNLVYGFAFFLFFSGVFRKDIQSIAMSLLVVFMYGSIVWGVLPLRWEISWEGHLMGGIAGAFIAYIYRRVDLPPPPDEDEDEEEEPGFNDWMYTQDPDEWKYKYKPKDY